jgi:starvation-inducible outer membrane lipoprotein
VKKILLLTALALSLSACDAQTQQLNKANAALDSARAENVRSREQIDSAKAAFALTVALYNDTVSQMRGQITELNYMLAACPDSAVIKNLEYQKHALEVQIANMQIEMDKCYILMKQFNTLSEEFLASYEEKYLSAEDKP